MRWPDSVSALRERNLARYVGAVAVTSLGSGMAAVALAFAVLEIGDFSDLGVVLLLREIPIIVLLLLGGVWADRISRRRILVGCELVRGAAQLATAALLLSGHAAVWSLALAQVAFGMATAFSRPANVGLIKQIVSVEHLQQANALAGLMRSSSSVVGPALGAVIVELASPGIALGVDAASFFASAVLIGGIRLAGGRPSASSSGVLADLRAGWTEFVSRTWVWLMVASFGLFQLTYFPALLVLGPTVSKNDLGGAGAWGTILSVGAAGSILGGLIALRVRFRRPLVAMSLFTLAPGVLLIALAVPAPVVLLAAASFVVSAALGVTDPIWFTTLQKHIPEQSISRISSFDWFGSVALNPIGYALIGPLAASVGIGRALAVSGVLNICTGLLLLTLPSIRGLRDDPDDLAAAR